MCGLFGYITKENTKLTKKQRQTRANIVTGLALINQTRGNQSTGVAGLNKKTYQVFKKAVSAEKFVKTADFKEVISANNNILIGHTRFATVGDVTDDNAHPFEIGDIIGCHNGGVDNYASIGNNFKVDSQAIFHLLNKHNNNYKKAFQKLTGRFAITWFDINEPDTLFLTIDGNPLSIVKIKELETYFYSSEFYALEAIIGSYFSLENKFFWTPKDSQVYKFNTNLQIKKEYAPFKENIVEVNDYQSWNSWKNKPVKNKLLKSLDDYDDNTNYYKVMDLPIDEMTMIVRQFEDFGCGYCELEMKEDIGFWWSQQDKVIICSKCFGELDPTLTNLIWINHNDYLNIASDVEEFEEIDEKNDIDFPPTN